jgi:integrase/recombinase XerD
MTGNPNSIRYATREQIDALLRAAKRNVRDRALLTVMYWRGLRASEAGKLMLADYNQQARRLFVRRAKRGLSAEYPLSPDEISALAAWLRVRGPDPGPLFVSKKQRPVSRQLVFELVRRYAQMAGWPDGLAHPHTLRHSIAVHLVEQGVDLLAIKDWLGHSSINSTVIYAQLTSRTRNKVAEQVYSSAEPEKVRVDWSRNERRRR